LIKVFFDTNVLVSAVLFPQSVPAQVFATAVTPPCRAVICDYTFDEFNRVFTAKFPDKVQGYKQFLSFIASSVEIVLTPPGNESVKSESQIRDVKDRPILRAAIAVKADILITGDKDFLESGISIIRIMSAAAFMDMIKLKS